MQHELGTTIPAANIDLSAREMLRALGYASLQDGSMRRQIDLLSRQELVASAIDDAPSLDAIAVVSIYRPQLQTQYLHRTLRSVLAELPSSATINVLVGNDDLDYVSPQTLRRELGEQGAKQIHVIAPPAGVAAFFTQENTSTSFRAAWNYARALRSYHGTGVLMVLEDDIEFAQNSFAHLKPWLSHLPTQATSLFNGDCRAAKSQWARSDTRLSFSRRKVHHNHHFPSIQAMLFEANVANEAGDYLAFRAGMETHDYMLGRVFAKRSREMALPKPSMVQHFGFQTTGLSSPEALPISRCYLPQF